jgi:hypothetical protein
VNFTRDYFLASVSTWLQKTIVEEKVILVNQFENMNMISINVINTTKINSWTFRQTIS